MTELEFDLPRNRSNKIKVLGIGGGGSNAVSYMFQQGIKDVDFIVCNTDAQVLELSPVPVKIQLGKRGLGAGCIPDVGREATLENLEQIKEILSVNTEMLFVTAGMGGGTGTGGAPVVAQLARELNILTVGIVTMPFSFEGRKRRQQAENGIQEMRKYVDSLLIINNDKLRELYGDLKLGEAFHRADNILTTAARGIAEIITVPGYVNVDFEDVKTVMKNSGKAIMGSETAEGENRAIKAVQGALSSPLLNDNTIKGADNILLYINSGTDEVTLDEVSEITDYIQNEAGQTAEILWGNGTDERLGSKISVTLIATGFDSKKVQLPEPVKVYIGALTPSDDKTADSEPAKQPGENGQKPVAESDQPVIKKVSGDIFKSPIQAQEIMPVITNFSSDEIQLKASEPEPNQIAEPLKEQEEISLFAPVRNQHEDKPETNNQGDRDQLQKNAQDRIGKLRNLSTRFQNPDELAALENQPAYLRRNVQLSEPPAASDSQASRYALFTDDENNTDIRSNNSYLFDNPD